MNQAELFAIIKQKAGIMILAGLLLAAVTFWGTMIFSQRFQSNFDLLIVQNQEGFVDSYTLAKSTEHYSKLLSESVYSESFLGKVVEGYPDLGKTLPIDREKRIEQWNKMIRTNLNVELGILHMKVLADDKSQAEGISKAVASALGSSNNLFVSENQKIEVRMLNAPLVKNNPSMASLALLTFVSFLIGAMIVFTASFYAKLLGQGKSGKAGFDHGGIWDRILTKDSEGNMIDAHTGEILK